MHLFYPLILTFILFNADQGALFQSVEGLSFIESASVETTDTLAQVRVTGIVTSATSGEPLQGTTIYVQELERGVTTDDNGFFELLLPAGVYTLYVQYLGMEPITREIVVAAEEIRLEFEMTEQDMDLGEIVVEGVGFGDNIRGAITGVEVVSISDLTRLPQFMGEIDVVQSLVALPGVQTVGEGASGFNVRGGREDQNLVLMEGAPIFNSSHVLGLFSVFNPDVTGGYALYKGHMPERFGGRLSSVLDVSMRSGSMEELKVQGGIGLYSGRLLVEGPVVKEKLSFLIAGRAAASEVIFRIVGKERDMMRISLPGDVYNSNARFYDTNLNLTYRANPDNRVSISYYGSDDLFRFTDDFGYSWENRIINLKWLSTISDHLYSDFSAVKNRYRSSYFTPVGPDAFDLRTGIGYVRFQEHFLYTGFQNQTVNGGFEWTRYSSDDESMGPYHTESVITPERVAKDSGRELALYLGNEWEVTGRIVLSMGARYSQFHHTGPGVQYSYREGVPRTSSSVTDSTRFAAGDRMASFRGFEPRFSARVSTSDNSSVKFSYNRTRQYIHQISNSVSPTPADIWQVSTSHLPPQKSHNFSIGYFRNFDNANWETSIDFYYREVDDLVEYIDFADLFLNPAIETGLISAKGRAYGSELNIQKTSGNWTGWLSYTLGRTFVKAAGSFPEEEVNSGDWFPSNYDQPHNINLTGVRSLGEKSSFSFNFTWRTGRPITAIRSSYLDNRTTVPVFSDRNSYRIPDYIRLDLSFLIADNIWAARTQKPNRRISDSANITFYNILGRKNAFSVFYRRKPGAAVPAPNRLSVLGAVIPSFTYNLSF